MRFLLKVMNSKKIKQILALTAAVAVTVSQIPYGAYAETMYREQVVSDSATVAGNKTGAESEIIGNSIGNNNEKTGNGNLEATEEFASPGLYLCDGNDALASPDLVRSCVNKGIIKAECDKRPIEISVNENGSLSFDADMVGQEITITVSGEGMKERSGKFVLDPEAAIETGLVLAEKEKAGLTAQDVSVMCGESVDLSAFVTADTDAEPAFALDTSDTVTLTGRTLTALAPGNATVRITTAETANYLAGEAILTVTCTKKDLGAIDASAIRYKEETLIKTYDGTNSFTVQGVISTGIAEQPETDVTLTLTADSANAGEQDTVISDLIVTGDAAAICTASVEEGTEGPKVMIQPFPVTIDTESRSISYGSTEWETVAEGKTPEMWANGCSIREDTPDSKDSVLEDMLNKGMLTMTVSPCRFVGEHKDALSISADNTKAGNYTIKEATPADIIVTPEETPDDEALYDRIYPEKSQNVSVRDGVVYARPGADIRFVPRENEPYNAVIFGDAVEAGVLSISEDAEDGTIMPAFHLAHTDDAGKNTRTVKNTETQDNTVPADRIVIDGTEPEISFGELKQTTTDGAFSWIASLFGQNKVSVTLSASDTGSGIASFRYKTILAANKTEAQKAAKEASEEDRSAWDAVPEDGKVTLAEPKNGFWVILAEAIDNTGNGVLASSQGIVIETAPPHISVEGLTNGAIYHDDIDYTITAQDDMSAAYSGLAELTAVLVVDGKEIPVSENGELTNSFSLTGDALKAQFGERESVSDNSIPEEQPDGGLDTEDIRIAAEGVTVKARITKDVANSNDIVLRLYAKDLAGNSTQEEYRIMLDAKTPEISASFNNDTKPTNEHYFNKAREFTIRIKERNYDPKDIRIMLGMNGTQKVYDPETFANADTVTLLSKDDTEDKTDRRSLTDERTIVYRYLIGAEDTVDIDYSLAVLCDAPEGPVNVTLSGADAAFTIDRVAPLIETKLIDGISGTTQGNQEEPAYSRSSMTTVVTVHERNFTVSDRNAQIHTELTAHDAEGRNVENAVNAKAAMQDASSWQTTDGLRYERTDTFTEEAAYRLAVSVEDLAGNTASTDDMYFTVDRTAPTATLTESKNNNIFTRLAEAIRGFIFSDSDIRFTAGDFADNVSGFSHAGYLIGRQDTPMSVEELSNESFVPVNGEIRVAPDSQAVVYLAVTDKAGNTAYISSDKLAIADKTAPKAPVIAIGRAPDVGGFYTSDIPFTITVEDPAAGGTYAGIESVVWTVTADGLQTQVSDGTADAAILTDPYTRTKTWTVKGTVDASLNDGNEIIVHAEVRDRAGNRTIASSDPVRIDRTAPRITIAYDNNDVRKERFFRSGRTMTVTVEERNFSEEGLTFRITANGTTGTYSLSDIRAGRIPGVTYEGRSGSGKDGAYDNDPSRTSTFKIGFGLNGQTDCDYSVSVRATDMAGNTSASPHYADGTTAGSNFTIDEIAPVITVSYEGGISGVMTPGTDSEQPTYDRRSVTAKAEVRERNIRRNNLSADCTITVTKQDAEGNSVNTLDNEDAAAVASWGGMDPVYTETIAHLTEDGNYSLGMTVTDLAGNSTVYAPHYVTVDKTIPEGTVTIDTGSASGQFSSFSSVLRFLFFGNRSIRVDHTADDAISGIKSVLYYLWEPGPEMHGEFASLTSEELAGVRWNTWNHAVTVDPDTGAVVYMRLEDKAGNVCYVNSQGGLIADATAPANPEITVITPASANGIYNSDVRVSIHAEDISTDGTYAGLRNVSYRIINNDTVTQSGSFADDLSDSSARIRELTREITIDADKNNSNHVRVEVVAEDNAGNRATSVKDLRIDITAPVIEIDYSRPDIGNTYTNSPVTATIRVTERNFDPAAFSLTLNEERGAEAEIGSWTLAPDMGENDSAVSTCTVTFNRDGAYTLTAACRDMAGNAGRYEKTDRFVVDMTAPIIKVSYDVPGTENGGYYNRPITATVVIEDRFADESGFRASVSAMLDGKDIEAPSFGGFVREGDTISTSVTFASDGDYALNLAMTDKAGNQAVKYGGTPFTIDMTPPVITMTGITNHAAINDDKVPSFTFTDRNFYNEGHLVTITGTHHESREAAGNYTAGTKSGTFTLIGFDKNAETDDIYTVYAETRDLAGNTADITVMFSINRYGSVYTFDDKTTEIINQRYVRNAGDITIYETNTDSLIAKGVTVSRNGEILSVKENRDYVIRETGGEEEWKICEYILQKSLFSEEGLYEIRIDSEDRAGNRQDNQLKERPVSFVVDRTAPMIAFSGITDNGRYEENAHSFVVTAADNFAFGEVKVTINGKETVYTAEDIAEYEGRIPVVAESADDWQTIELTAVDAAGNIAQEKTVRVLVTTNRFLQFMANKPLFFGTCGGTAGLAGLIIFLLLKKKKKEEEHTTDELKHTDSLGKTTDELDKQ